MGSWRFVGQSLPRTEDRRLLTGLGRYTSDLAAPDACRLVVLRSPHAAARIRGFDIATAARMPGVRLVLTLAAGTLTRDILVPPQP